MLISQYRHAIQSTNYELCAGVIDPQDNSPMDAAKRELLEETGFGGGEWSEFMVLSPNPTNHNNFSHTFLALGVERLQEQDQESTEDIRVHIFSPQEVLTLLEQGGFIQALHAAPLWKYFATTR